MRSRTEFTVKIMRQARDRSGGLCEAVGMDYGLAVGCRCNGDLSKGVQFDHVVPDGLGGLATLENCAAVCGPCHRRKTAKVDVPRIAKAKRRETRHLGIKKPSSFRKPPAGTRYEQGPHGLRAILPERPA